MHFQGSLDSLCGIYASINAISLMVEIDETGLFSYLIGQIDDRLGTILVNGLGTHDLRRLVLGPCQRFCAERQILLKYRTCQSSTLDKFWQCLQNHVALHGAGSIILGVDEHWTCIRQISAKTIILADSSGLVRLYRRYVSTGTDALHQLFPTSTFLLSITDDRKKKAR